MSKTWRCAVVGMGLVGQWHARVIAQLPEAQLAAVCNRNPEKARAALQQLNLPHIPVYADVHEMLNSVPLDVVHLCTPSGAHLEPAIAAMEAGKNVICEKPIEVTLDRVDRMLDAARQHHVRLAGIFQKRWEPANQALKQAVDEGRFGRIAWAGSFTPWYRTDPYYAQGGWRGTWAMDGGGAAMNQGIHAIDLLQWIVGPVQQVSAYAASRIHDRIEVEDTLSCSLQFANGAFGTIVGTTAMYPGLPVRIEVGGEGGTAISENGLKCFQFRQPRPGDAELLQRLSPNLSTTSGGGANPADVNLDLHVLNIRHILDAWSHGRDAETSGHEARKAVALVLAMYQSVQNHGTPVTVR